MAEALKSVETFLARSPPGQLEDVLRSCRQLTGAPEGALRQACCEYNEKHLLALPIGEGQLGIVCSEARLGDPQEAAYLDPETNFSFVVDHEQQAVLSVKPSGCVAATALQVAIQAQLNKYIADAYEGGGGRLGQGIIAAKVFCSGGEKTSLCSVQMVLSSRRLRPQGLWAGSWTSRWRTSFSPGQKEPAPLSGSIGIAGHYAEDGNGHLKRTANVSSSFSAVADLAQLASNLVLALAELESQVQAVSEDRCDALGLKLKALRRVLPLAKEKFDWRPLRHALVKDMKAASKEDLSA